MFYSEIKKYGWNHIKHKIIHTNLSKYQAFVLELLYIRFFQEKNISLNISNKGLERCPIEDIMTIKRRFFDPCIKKVDIIYTIYMHITPSGKVYIGQTSKADPNERWKNGRGYKDNRLFYLEIEKYGWDNIEHKLLYTNLSKKQAFVLELLYIRFFKLKHISLNIDDGRDVRFGEEALFIKRKFFDPYIKQFDIIIKELIDRIYEKNELKKQLAVLNNPLFVKDPSELFK